MDLNQELYYKELELLEAKIKAKRLISYYTQLYPDFKANEPAIVKELEKIPSGTPVDLAMSHAVYNVYKLKKPVMIHGGQFNIPMHFTPELDPGDDVVNDYEA